MINKNFWQDKNVLITGHTGFKGSWLCLLLNYFKANITGYALNPPTQPSLFELCNIEKYVTSITGDIRDKNYLNKVIQEREPEIVIHLAAQPIVRESYKNPFETYEINILGTVNLLEALRNSKTVKSIINVTTDKCYENREWHWPYREKDHLGGYDPYSSSKACSEIITSSYRNSFFKPLNKGLASARAGNVIGGGDWAKDRLIPDCIRAILNEKKIIIRNPDSLRPWQHVMEPLCGYLMLAEKLYSNISYGEAWNFGPGEKSEKSVEWIVKKLCRKWGPGASYLIETGNHPHEAACLSLDSSKARRLLEWHSVWTLEDSIDKIIEWTKAYKEQKNLNSICLGQIEDYLECNNTQNQENNHN